MDSGSITRGSLFVGASALNSFSQRVQATTYNIANVSTDGFQPVTAQLADGPRGQGVHLNSLTREGKPVTASGTSTTAASQSGFLPSATALEREFSHLISDQRAFQANVQSIRATDEMLGYVLDIKA